IALRHPTECASKRKLFCLRAAVAGSDHGPRAAPLGPAPTSAHPETPTSDRAGSPAPVPTAATCPWRTSAAASPPNRSIPPVPASARPAPSALLLELQRAARNS